MHVLIKYAPSQNYLNYVRYLGLQHRASKYVYVEQTCSGSLLVSFIRYGECLYIFFGGGEGLMVLGVGRYQFLVTI